MTAAHVGDRSDGWADPEFSRQSSRHSVTRGGQWWSLSCRLSAEASAIGPPGDFWPAPAAPPSYTPPRGSPRSMRLNVPMNSLPPRRWHCCRRRLGRRRSPGRWGCSRLRRRSCTGCTVSTICCVWIIAADRALRVRAAGLRLLAVRREAQPGAVAALAQHAAGGGLDGGAGADPGDHRDPVVQAALFHGRRARDRADDQGDRPSVVLELRRTRTTATSPSTPT